MYRDLIHSLTYMYSIMCRGKGRLPDSDLRPGNARRSPLPDLINRSTVDVPYSGNHGFQLAVPF